MGQLLYGLPPHIIEFDDRVLAHLDMVIIAKLRRDEKFTLSWDEDDPNGGRTTIWVHPAIPLQFRFAESKPPRLNRAWVEALMITANAGGGLRLVPEPTAVLERELVGQ